MAIIYVVVGLLIAVAGGTLLEKLKMERYVEDFARQAVVLEGDGHIPTQRERLYYAKGQMTAAFRKVFPYILLGVGVGAVIHNWLPEGWIEAILGDGNPFGVVLTTLVSVPMYADIFGAIPIAEALLSKGDQLGTVLSFMMAVTTLSLPSLILLRKVVKPKLLAAFLIVCTGGIIVVGQVTDFSQIAAYGVMTTPALVVDGKVLSNRRILTKGEAVTLLNSAFLLGWRNRTKEREKPRIGALLDGGPGPLTNFTG